jgi:hypothetical protein
MTMNGKAGFNFIYNGFNANIIPIQTDNGKWAVDMPIILRIYLSSSKIREVGYSIDPQMSFNSEKEAFDGIAVYIRNKIYSGDIK